MTIEELEEIFEKEYEFGLHERSDRVMKGLEIIYRLTGKTIVGADHDVIFSVEFDELIEGGITPEQANYLRELGWMNYEGQGNLAHYV